MVRRDGIDLSPQRYVSFKDNSQTIQTFTYYINLILYFSLTSALTTKSKYYNSTHTKKKIIINKIIKTGKKHITICWLLFIRLRKGQNRITKHTDFTSVKSVNNASYGMAITNIMYTWLG